MLWVVVSMATITIRNVPDELVDRIKWLAGQKGVSMEQEIRDLLQRSV
jgi:antitoxin FitA